MAQTYDHADRNKGGEGVIERGMDEYCKCPVGLDMFEKTKEVVFHSMFLIPVNRI